MKFLNFCSRFPKEMTSFAAYPISSVAAPKGEVADERRELCTQQTACDVCNSRMTKILLGKALTPEVHFRPLFLLFMRILVISDQRHQTNALSKINAAVMSVRVQAILRFQHELSFAMCR